MIEFYEHCSDSWGLKWQNQNRVPSILIQYVVHTSKTESVCFLIYKYRPLLKQR